MDENEPSTPPPLPGELPDPLSPVPGPDVPEPQPGPDLPEPLTPVPPEHEVPGAPEPPTKLVQDGRDDRPGSV